MAKRIKKPTIKPEQAREWLERYEARESPAQIAAADIADVRTVRRHIEEARQERERREARSQVLRNALESHYADLVKFAAKLDVEIARKEPSPISLRRERMWSALKQHLPRSPLWTNLDRWDNACQRLTELLDNTRAKLTKTAESDRRILIGLPAGGQGVVPGVIEALAFQTRSWPRGYRGLVLKEDLKEDPAGEGLVDLRYGFANMGKVDERHVKAIREALADLESAIRTWEEYSSLQKLFTEFERLERNVRDELAVIALRRIVPGRCKYCPL